MKSRAELSDEICRLLVAPSNVAVHGSPGSGKSWLSDQVIANLITEPAYTLRVDMSIFSNGLEVFSELAVGSPGHPSSDLVEFQSMRAAWKAARERFTLADQHTILILDEFDSVLRFEDSHDFLVLLRELVHRPMIVKCTALVLSRRSLDFIETSISGISTLASVFYTEYLGSTTPSDLDLMAPAGAVLDRPTVQACLNWSGGHAHLSKYWLALRPDIHQDFRMDVERSRVVVRILDHLTELQLLDAAAQFVLGPVVDTFLFERQELESLGVVKPSATSEAASDSEDSTWVATLSDMDLFQDALRHRTWTLNPWGLMGQAEVRLRGLIESTLSEAIGHEWPTELAKKSKSIRVAIAGAEEKMHRDETSFGRKSPWLSYTYPADLWEIIQDQWSLFVKVFSTHDKRYWREVFTGLAKYRAPLAHGRPEVLNDSQKYQCRLYATEVLARIQQSQSSAELDRTLQGT